MRALAALVLFAGCAQGSRAATSDGDIGQPLDGTIEQPVDSAIDAHVNPPADGPPMVDAMVDAKPIDAPPMPDAMQDAYVCTVMTRQLLLNPVFDLTPRGANWVEQADSGLDIITDEPPFVAQTAPYKAWLGGYTGMDIGQPSATDQLHQDVAIPAGTTQLVLTGYYAVGTQETTTTTVYDTGQLALVQTNGTPIEVVLSLSNLTTVGAWTPINKTFANPAGLSGQTVRLRMTATNDISFASNFFFDSFALTATYCQ